jgi:hypothetical protein
MEKWEGIIIFTKTRGLVLPAFIVGYWALVWFFGFFATTIWAIIFAAVIGIWIRLTGRG